VSSDTFPRDLERLPFHDASGTASWPAQLTQGAARGRESRWIPRLSALSLCGPSQGRGAGEPDQSVDGPFAELDGPLRRAITIRRSLSARIVRKRWFGIWVGRIGLQKQGTNSPITRRVNLSWGRF